MATFVLIASPTIAFGELIRLTLEGEGNYHATRVSTGCEALAQCQSTPFALAILDADLSDLPLPDLFTAVQKLRPGIRLIVVPPNSDPKSPIVAGLPSHGYLNKPFYLPELINIVTHALQLPDQPQGQPPEAQPATGMPPAPTRPTPQKTPGPAIDSAPFDGALPKRPASKPIAPTAPAWLQDVARAAQHLTRLSLETAALAALIIRDGKLWAYAGQLSQPAAQELAQTVAHYWERGNGSDLARFIHLDATDGDYMLYATAVSGDMALAMVFDIEMPFSKIRSQASHLARSLASPPGSVPPQPGRTSSPAAPPQWKPSSRKAKNRSISPTSRRFSMMCPPPCRANRCPPWPLVSPEQSTVSRSHPLPMDPRQLCVWIPCPASSRKRPSQKRPCQKLPTSPYRWNLPSMPWSRPRRRFATSAMPA